MKKKKNSPIKNFTNKWKIIGITSMGIAAISVGLVIGFASALSNKNDNNIIIPISTTLREYSENPNSYDQSASDWETDSSYSNKKMIPVPDLLNLSREEAISTCLDAGLDYSFDVKPSDRTEKNIVISQAISPNTLVPVGTKLEFIVSN